MFFQNVNIKPPDTLRKVYTFKLAHLPPLHLLYALQDFYEDVKTSTFLVLSAFFQLKIR